jgi:hypothetical protein
LIYKESKAKERIDQRATKQNVEKEEGKKIAISTQESDSP